MKNIVRKEEIACNKQFLLFSQCFLPNMALIFRFKCTLKCRLQSVSVSTSLQLCRQVMGKYHLSILYHIMTLLSIFPTMVMWESSQ